MTIAEYLNRKYLRTNTTFIIKADGTGVYQFEGKEYSAKEFEKMNVLPVSLVLYSVANSDTTKRWLIDD